MPTILTDPAVEGSSCTITIVFTYTPNAGTLTWSLVDYRGHIVNSRNDIPKAEASTVKFLLGGADLVCPKNKQNTLRLIVNCEYDDADGSDRTFVDYVEFPVKPVPKVSGATA